MVVRFERRSGRHEYDRDLLLFLAKYPSKLSKLSSRIQSTAQPNPVAFAVSHLMKMEMANILHTPYPTYKPPMYVFMCKGTLMELSYRMVNGNCVTNTQWANLSLQFAHPLIPIPIGQAKQDKLIIQRNRVLFAAINH